MANTDRNQVFAEWLREHRGLMLKVVRAFAFTDADQDDLLQEVATGVWKCDCRRRTSAQLGHGFDFRSIACFVYLGHRHRLLQSRQTATTLMAHLDQAIASAGYQVRRSRTFLAWFVVPSAVAMLISISMEFHGRPL